MPLINKKPYQSFITYTGGEESMDMPFGAASSAQLSSAQEIQKTPAPLRHTRLRL